MKHYPKPPLGKVKGEILRAILNLTYVSDQADRIYRMISFKMVMRKYWYEIRYWIWKLRTEKIKSPS